MEPPTAREVIARLEREGFEDLGCTGDHRKFRKDGRLVVVSGQLGDHAPRELGLKSSDRPGGSRGPGTPGPSIFP